MWKMTISRSAHVSSASTLASIVFQDPIVSDAGLLRYPQFCSAPLEEGHGRLPSSISAGLSPKCFLLASTLFQSPILSCACTI